MTCHGHSKVGVCFACLQLDAKGNQKKNHHAGGRNTLKNSHPPPPSLRSLKEHLYWTMEKVLSQKRLNLCQLGLRLAERE